MVALIAISFGVKYVIFDILKILDESYMHWFADGAYWIAVLATFISGFSFSLTRRNPMFMFFLLIFMAVIVTFTFFIKI